MIEIRPNCQEMNLDNSIPNFGDRNGAKCAAPSERLSNYNYAPMRISAHMNLRLGTSEGVSRQLDVKRIAN